MIRVLFVCMGNICRSPTAQGVFEHVVEEAGLSNEILIDSAGTYAYHIGEPPDRRAQAAAAKRGIDLSRQKARKVQHSDFEHFDYVLAMDQDNLADLDAICPSESKNKLNLLMVYASKFDEISVPDPYYGGAGGFEKVLDMIEDGAQGLILDIRNTV